MTPLRPLLALLTLSLMAADPRGVVKFAGLPVPGATVRTSRGDQRFSTVTNLQGEYVFPSLAPGEWTFEVEMQLFTPQRRVIQVAADSPPEAWELQALAPPPLSAAPKKPFERTEVAATPERKPPPPTAAPEPAAAQEMTQRAADGFLLNGSVNNGASSPFALMPAFGNRRLGQRAMYNGNLGFIWNNSSFDARPFSLTGQSTPQPDYNRVQGLFAFGGPIKIPRLLRRNGPMLTVNYQWTRNSDGRTLSGLMPAAAERAGDFSGRGMPIIDPSTQIPFPANRIPEARLSPQARILQELYPLPNFAGSSRYNFQTPVLAGYHQDDLQTRVNKRVRRNFLSGSFAWQSTRNSNPDLFGFLDTSAVSGLNTTANFRRGLTARSFINLGVQYSRFATRAIPFFSYRRNVSGEAGITGNNQEPVNWGPPSLSFSSGIASLSQSQAARNRNQTAGVSADGYFNRGRHNLFYGYAYRRQQFNILSQENPRGSFAFTGAGTGLDYAGFLLGLPDTSAIAFGNADKYLRGSIQELFLNDDWRVNHGLTINAGVRWEYWSPLLERYGRLVNLAVAPGFTAAAPGGALPQPDRNNAAPRLGFAWRPLPASSLVVRGGYGIYHDTSVYPAITTRMSQQAPLSRSLRVARSAELPLTLANGFPFGLSPTEATTFGVDPSFRVGYSQQWQLSIQRDLPGALQIVVTYNGSKGTRAQQQFLPNTFPDGARAPSGFTYLTSNGNSIRHAGQIQLRRRLRSGLAAELNYTLAKSLDNAALGGRNQSAELIAQNWLDLRAERARSNFDQRHLLTATFSYTTGMGRGRTAFGAGKAAALLREWTLGGQLNAGSGLPLTPVYLAPVRGTGVTGPLRPDYTGADLYAAAPGFHLNPAACATPAAGRWGNAGRNSITGPSQFALGASLSRSFRSSDRIGYDIRLEAANVLNTVTYPAWNTVVGNAQFGLPVTANPMRTIQAVVRVRY